MALAIEHVTFRPKRAIGSFTSQVTIEEAASDDITITQHPVEQGAAITDHAFKNPAQLSIRAGWSNASLAALLSAGEQLAAGNVGALFGGDYVRGVYAKLLELQASREPVTIVTGKRKYKNMLMRSLAQTTDQATENVLIVTATFQEIIVVETQTAVLPPAARQAAPQKTSPIEPAGAKQLAPAPAVNQSALAALASI